MAQFLAISPTYSPWFCLPKMDPKLTYDFITSFERAHFKLPEKQKIVKIGQSKPKLWPFKVIADIGYMYNSTVCDSLIHCLLYIQFISIGFYVIFSNFFSYLFI